MNVFPTDMPRPPVRHVRAGLPPAQEEQADTSVSAWTQEEDGYADRLPLPAVLAAFGLLLLVGVPSIWNIVRWIIQR